MLQFFHVALVSCCTLPPLHFIQGVLSLFLFFLFCRFLALHLVHVALIHNTLFSSCIFSQVSLFSCVTCILLKSFPTALFITLYTFPIGFFHVAHFPCYMLYTFILHFFMLHYFHLSLFPCCTVFVVYAFHLAPFCVSLFSCCNFFTLHAFPVALCSCYTFFILHSTIFAHFFHLVLFYAFSMLRSFEIALFHVA